MSSVKSTKHLFYLIAFLAAGACGAAGMWAVTRNPDPQDAGPPMISLETMGHLVSVKVNYANVIEFLQPRVVGVPLMPWNLSLGGTKVLLVAKGDCMVASDLRHARYDNIDTKKHVLTVVLPTPAPLQARINHDAKDKGGSYFYAITQQGLQLILPGQQAATSAMTTALQRAQSDVERSCKQAAILDMAKANSEAVISKMLITTGWKAKFVWQ